MVCSVMEMDIGGSHGEEVDLETKLFTGTGL